MTTPYKLVNDAQKLAAEPDYSVWVSANAGSGKTKVLIDRVARLLLTGVSPDSILCITYTKAAASEMQQRLFKRLGSWSVLPDEELAEDLKKLQGENAAVEEDDLRKARALFARALETPGGLRIETLHAFAGRVLRRFPLEAGVPPGFQELDEASGKDLWHAAARTAFEQLQDTENGLDLFRRLMLEIGGLRYDGIRDLIEGNAMRLRRFLSEARTPSARRRVISDFLNAPDMSEADCIEQLVGQGLPKDQIGRAISQLESSSAKKDQTLATNLRDVLYAASPELALDLYRKVFFTATGPLRKPEIYTKAFQGTAVENLFSIPAGTETTRFLAGLDQLNAIKLRDRTLDLLALAEPILTAHEHEKRIRAGLDFDDLILETRSLLVEADLSEWVLYKLDGGISHVLLDEAQDTSPDQWQIVNSLVSEFFAGAGTADLIRTLFVVGDEKQSIYSFQGADTAQFQRERQGFAARQDGENGASVHLPDIAMSFRSTPEVLGYVDAVFNGPAGATGAPFSHEIPTTADTIQHHAFRDAHQGQVEIWPLEAPEAIPTGVPWDAPMDMERQISPARSLALKIADWIDDRLKPGAPGIYEEGRDSDPRPARAGDILILVRSRKALFHAIIQALKAKDLPVAGADRLNILDTLAVQDILNLIRFALLPEDDLAFAEIMKGAFLGLLDDDKHLFPLAWKRDRESLWSRFAASDDPAYAAGQTFLNGVLARRHLPAFEFLSWLLNARHESLGQTGWQAINARFSTPARDPVDALVSIATNLDDTESTSLQAFIIAVEKQAGEIKREASGPADEIRVMTVHGSKGLEAPIVILPDTTGVGKNRLAGNLVFSAEGLPIWLGKADVDCPATTAMRDIEIAKSRAESHRLLYVALTRAKDQLVICGAWHGGVNGKGYVDGSWYDLCTQTAELWQGETAQNFDDGRWQLGGLPPPVTIHSAPTAKTATTPLPDWVRQILPNAHAEPGLRAPSSLLPGDTPVLPPFGEDQVRRFQRGRLIHALLEILPDVPLPSRRARAERYLERCLDEDQGELAEDILNVTFSVLEAPELAPVFGPGGRAEAPIVGSGPNLPSGVIINGRIDRMRITEDEVWVIDYKTDRPPPKTQDGVAEPYLAQLGSYFDVLSVTYPNKSVKCALLWTDGPHFMVLDESVMLSALKKAQAQN